MKKTRYGHYIVCALLGMAAFALVYRCPIYFICGVPCPGCNMTRALIRAALFDLKGAFFLHPLFFVVLLFAIICARCFFKGNWRLLHDKRLIYTTLGLFLCVYVVRMVLFFPDQPPMEFNEASLLARLLGLMGG